MELKGTQTRNAQCMKIEQMNGEVCDWRCEDGAVVEHVVWVCVEEE